MANLIASGLEIDNAAGSSGITRRFVSIIEFLQRKALAAAAILGGLAFVNPAQAQDSPVSHSNLEEKKLISDIARSMAQTFTDFEVAYSFASEVLPGYEVWVREQSAPGSEIAIPKSNPDGFNQISEVLYKRTGDAFYLKSTDLFDPTQPGITEFHSDGILSWEHKHINKRVNILSQHPRLPFLYNNLLTIFPFSQSEYGDVLPNANLLTNLLSQSDSEIQVVNRSDGIVDVRIIGDSKNPIPGMKVMHLLTFNLEPVPELQKYSFQGIYRDGKEEHVFHPLLEVQFKDYMHVGLGAPRIPREIEINEYRMRESALPRNAAELISFDKEWLAIKKNTVKLKNFQMHPAFKKGEIDFWYPPGTEIVDMFANRVYLTGDTVEILREKVEKGGK